MTNHQTPFRFAKFNHRELIKVKLVIHSCEWFCSQTFRSVLSLRLASSYIQTKRCCCYNKKRIFYLCLFCVSFIVGRCSSKHNVWRWCIMLACVYFVFIQILLSQNILDFFKCKHGCVSECAYVRRETETRVGYRGEARILICIRRFLFIQIFTRIISIIRTALIL